MTELPCRAILFDCDGVLVDSDASVIAAWTRWANELGLDPDDVVPMVHGRRSADTVAALVAPDRRVDALGLIDRFEVEDAASVRPIAGADALLRSMPPDHWAVVTSGTTALATARLAAAGLPRPGVLITADDVAAGKPDPEGYRTAAARLGVTPRKCIVLEDTLAGVRAARAAGASAVVGIGADDSRLAGAADVVAPDLRGLRWSGAALHLA